MRKRDTASPNVTRKTLHRRSLDSYPSVVVLCSGVGYGTVGTILEKVISSPAEVDLPELDDAIQWVEDRGTIRRLDRGTDRNVYSPQFDAAAVEMRVLRRLLANDQLAGATASAQRVLTLLAT